MNIPSSQIDGDFFDFFSHEEGIVDVFIGDAMGKGVPAALVAAGAKSYLIRGFASLLKLQGEEILPSPVTIVQHAHDGLAKEFIAIGSFVTLCYLRLDTAVGKATYVDCGHTKTIRWDNNSQRATILKGGNFPIGFVDLETYQEYETTLDEGDLFCLYSDGVTEAADPDGELFGTQRLLALIDSLHDQEPSLILSTIREAVRAHTTARSLADDFTCVLVRVGQWVKPWTKKEAEFPSSLNSLANIRRFVKTTAGDCHLDRQQIDEMQIAAHEAATNAIVHGQLDQPDDPIRNAPDARLSRRGVPARRCRLDRLRVAQRERHGHVHHREIAHGRAVQPHGGRRESGHDDEDGQPSTVTDNGHPTSARS